MNPLTDQELDVILQQAESQRQYYTDRLLTYHVSADVAHPPGYDNAIDHDPGESVNDNIHERLANFLIDNYETEPSTEITQNILSDEEDNIIDAFYSMHQLSIDRNGSMILQAHQPHLGGNAIKIYSFNPSMNKVREFLKTAMLVMPFKDNNGRFINVDIVTRYRTFIATNYP